MCHLQRDQRDVWSQFPQIDLMTHICLVLRMRKLFSFPRFFTYIFICLYNMYFCILYNNKLLFHGRRNRSERWRWQFIQISVFWLSKYYTLAGSTRITKYAQNARSSKKVNYFNYIKQEEKEMRFSPSTALPRSTNDDFRYFFVRLSKEKKN